MKNNNPVLNLKSKFITFVLNSKISTVFVYLLKMNMHKWAKLDVFNFFSSNFEKRNYFKQNTKQPSFIIHAS